MNIRSALLALILFAGAAAASAEEATLRVEIVGLENVEGKVIISVYDNEDDWLGKGAVVTETVDIVSARVDGLVVNELNLPTGNYAVSLFYDENDNGQLDSNFIGIPKEPVALSNNARPRFGPPRYRDAVFALEADGAIQRITIESI